MRMHPLQLIADQLQVTRGARTIIRNLSFKVAAGEALLLTGANGAGKTTLIRTLAGFLAPSGGTISLDGGDPERDISEQAHYVGHANGIKASLTVAENLRFWTEYLAEDDRDGNADRLEAALDHFNLLDLSDIPAGYLSAGQRRRLGLARLLVAHRTLWLLDEPTVSLDTASVTLLAKAVDAHVTGGGIAIAATHIPLGLAKTRELRLVGGVAAEAA
jgi:heme exporter protein A